MKIQIGEISLHVEIDETLLNKGLIPILFIHGFTGSSSEWKSAICNTGNKFLPFAIDLIGHGNSDSPPYTELYTAGSLSKQINEVIIKLNFGKIIICGYSMGGRAALSYYANYPDSVMGLILESTTPGIEEIQLRNDRIKSDELLARKIETDGVEEFGNYWLSLPIFESLKSLPQDDYRNVLNAKTHNNPMGLINSLKGFGTGSMPVLWEIIGRINVPTLLITGEYDSKFTAINERIKMKINRSEHIIMKECGHNTHLEKPVEFINLVNKYLSDNFSRE